MKILVFAPHAATWIHAFPEALVAEALSSNGHEIVYVTCDRQFAGYCVAMTSAGLPPEAPEARKQEVCNRCRANAGLLRQQFAFRGFDLGAQLTPADAEEIAQRIATVRREEFAATEAHGLPVGRIALYQLLIRRKKMNLSLSDEEWPEYVLHLTATLRAAAAMRRILSGERPDRILLYNGLYSVNLVCRQLAEREGVPTYFLHAGGNLAHRLQTLMIGRDHTFRYYPSILGHWPRFSERAVSLRLARLITDHFMEVLRGRSGFVYSNRKGSGTFRIRERFGIPDRARILVATLGSYDEEFAAEAVGARVHRGSPVFPTQADWVRALCELAATRVDLFFIIRVHPREFPNRREQVQSQHADSLRSALVGLPRNMAVNWPDDQISLYDLAEEADVFLNSWSSVGKEMSLLGLPVVTHVPELLFYPPDLNYAATTRAEYFILIDRALADGWSAERIRRTYRWLAVEYGYGLVDIADGYSARETERPMLSVRAWNRARRILDPLYAQKRDCARRPARLEAAALISRLLESGRDTILDVLGEEDLEHAGAADEDQILRDEISRLMPHLYPVAVKPLPGSLHARLREFAG